MLDWLVRSIGLFLKKCMGRGCTKHTPLNLSAVESWPLELSCTGRGYLNDVEIHGKISIEKDQVFPFDNTLSKNVRKNCNVRHRKRNELQVQHLHVSTYSKLLNHFIESARIPSAWRYEGLYYAGYSLQQKQFILPSWIWTNGIIVEHLSLLGHLEAALELADRLLKLQLPSGGWVVRYDYVDLEAGVSPVVAPNDSAYCADHGLLTAYRLSGDLKYLKAAERCAQWIMTEGNDSGLVLHSYSLVTQEWETEINILDIGFSAGLFCSLYVLTGKQQYLDFAERFLSRYIEAFYRGKGIFASGLRGMERVGKGIFARGHAWALEGMIPFYELTGNPEIGRVIEDTVDFLLKSQHRNGGWLFNLRPGPVGHFSGYDNKGVPVIAASLSRWRNSSPAKSENIAAAIRLSIDWCLRHTQRFPNGAGGIFSSNFEGASVHSPNSAVAFVYSNCYLLALMREYKVDYKLQENRGGRWKRA